MEAMNHQVPSCLRVARAVMGPLVAVGAMFACGEGMLVSHSARPPAGKEILTTPFDAERVVGAGSTTCPEYQVYSERLLQCRQIVHHNPLPPYDIPAADPYLPASSTQAWDNYAYDESHASHENHGRTLAGQTISHGDLSLTSSVALAGAISSIRYLGYEMVASGGHGSAAQLVVHDWTRGYRDFSVDGQIVTSKDRPNECNNPTEAGNILDDLGHSFPFHGPSSSYIETLEQDAVNGLPRIYSNSWPVDYVHPGSWSEDSGYGRCFNASNDWFRGFQFHKHVILGFNNGRVEIDNLIQVNATIELQDGVELFDALFIIYLSRYFSKEYRFHVEDDYLVSKARGMSLKDQGYPDASDAFFNAHQLPYVPIFASSCGGMAIGMLVVPGAHPTEGYTQTQFDYHAPDHAHKFRNIAVRLTASDLGAGTEIPLQVMVFIGSLASVQQEIRQYCASEDCGGPGSTLGSGTHSRVFDWQQYLALNPDLQFSDAGEAISHWLLYGLREGRRGSDAFWSPSYLGKNPDLISYAQTRGYLDHTKATSHYVQWGFDEGREP